MPPAHMETAMVVALAASAGNGLPWWAAVPPAAMVVAPPKAAVAVAIASVWAAIVAVAAIWNLHHHDVAVVMALLCAWRASNADLGVKLKGL